MQCKQNKRQRLGLNQRSDRQNGNSGLNRPDRRIEGFKPRPIILPERSRICRTPPMGPGMSACMSTRCRWKVRTEALSEYSLILIFSSTIVSAKLSFLKLHASVGYSTEWQQATYPRAIAPTKTAIECVVGNVGRYLDSRTVCASPESAIYKN